MLSDFYIVKKEKIREGKSWNRVIISYITNIFLFLFLISFYFKIWGLLVGKRGVVFLRSFILLFTLALLFW